MTKCNSVLVAAFSSALAFTLLPAAAQERLWQVSEQLTGLA